MCSVCIWLKRKAQQFGQPGEIQKKSVDAFISYVLTIVRSNQGLRYNGDLAIFKNSFFFLFCPHYVHVFYPLASLVSTNSLQKKIHSEQIFFLKIQIITSCPVISLCCCWWCYLDTFLKLNTRVLTINTHFLCALLYDPSLSAEYH